LLGTSGLLLTGRAAFAQPARKAYRIGVLTSFSASDYAGAQPLNPNARALLRGLGDLGYVYGQHAVDSKFARLQIGMEMHEVEQISTRAKAASSSPVAAISPQGAT
jgi:hypothetical protein